MKTKFYSLHYLTILLLLYLFSPVTKAQDSLYLIGTITGDSYEKRITSVDRVGDVNADGYNDFMVSCRTGATTRDQGITQLYLGSASIDLIPDVTFHYPGRDTLNDLGNAAEIGDVNGDGFDDFTISGRFGDGGVDKGKVFLYYGGASIDTIPVAEFYKLWIHDGFGGVVEKVGDLNKDGYEDFSISSPYNWTNGLGYVYLFWGGDTISCDSSITFASNILNDFFGTSIANIGDVNKDGFEDFAIGAPAEISAYDTSKIYIFYGGTTIDNIPQYFLIGGDIFSIGDINGDDKTEFIIYTGQVKIYFSLDSTITFNSYVNSLCSGDIDNDGYNDFIIGNTNYRNSDSLMVGGAFVYLGREKIDTVYRIKLEGENKWDEFSKIMTATDINGDGYDELFILAPNYPDYNNPNGKIYIFSYKKLTGIKDYKENIPNNFKLNQNYPNPFNPSTTISYALPYQSSVELIIYDLMGREVKSFIVSSQSAGYNKLVWDGRNENENFVSSGVYFYRISIKSLENKELFLKTAKLMMMK